MIYVNDCSFGVVRSFIEIFVQVFAYENYFATKKQITVHSLFEKVHTSYCFTVI